MSETVLVTGATGLIGSTLFNHLSQFSSSDQIIGTTTRAKNRRNRSIVPCDFLNRNQVIKLLDRYRPRRVFHCMGSTAAGPWSMLYDVHVTATANLLSALSELSLKNCRVVIVGSAAEYGEIPVKRQPIREIEVPHPQSLYGISKASQTALALTFASVGLSVCVARVFNIMSPRLPDSFSVNRFALLVKLAKHSHQAIQKVGPLNSIRDFVALEDVVRALELLGRYGKSGEIYNVCSGEGHSMRWMFNRLMTLANTQVRYKEDKLKSLRTAVLRCVGSNRKIERQTGWRPKRGLDESLRELL